MKCQLFSFFGVLFLLAFTPGLTSVHATGETALDTATIEAITGLKGARSTDRAIRTRFKSALCRGPSSWTAICQGLDLRGKRKLLSSHGMSTHTATGEGPSIGTGMITRRLRPTQ